MLSLLTASVISLFAFTHCNSLSQPPTARRVLAWITFLVLAVFWFAMVIHPVIFSSYHQF